jgi:hypothetical protein
MYVPGGGCRNFRSTLGCEMLLQKSFEKTFDDDCQRQTSAIRPEVNVTLLKIFFAETIGRKYWLLC